MLALPAAMMTPLIVGAQTSSVTLAPTQTYEMCKDRIMSQADFDVSMLRAKLDYDMQFLEKQQENELKTIEFRKDYEVRRLEQAFENERSKLMLSFDYQKKVLVLRMENIKRMGVDSVTAKNMMASLEKQMQSLKQKMDQSYARLKEQQDKAYNQLRESLEKNAMSVRLALEKKKETLYRESNQAAEKLMIAAQKSVEAKCAASANSNSQVVVGPTPAVTNQSVGQNSPFVAGPTAPNSSTVNNNKPQEQNPEVVVGPTPPKTQAEYGFVQGGTDPNQIVPKPFTPIPLNNAEVEKVVNWLAKQPSLPTGTGPTQAEVWAKQGITNPMGNPRIIEQAKQVINRTNARNELLTRMGRDPVGIGER